MINRNLFQKELKRNRQNFIVWTSIVAGFTILVMSFFPSMQKMGESLEVMMESYPDGMKKAMGMTDAAWNSVLGFYSTYYNLHIMVLSGIFGMSVGSKLLAVEEKEHTSEFLYTRPINRKTVYFTKGLSLLVMVISLLMIQTLFGALGVLSFSENSVNWGNFTAMHCNGAVLVLFFSALGYFLPAFLKAKTNFMGISVGVVFGSYLINALSKTSESAEWIGYLSPFHYVNFSVSEADFGFSWAGYIGLILLAVVFTFLGIAKFQKRDIKT